MTSGKSDGGGRGPADDDGRKLLFGLPKEGEGPETEPRSPPRQPAGTAVSASPAVPPASRHRPGSQSAAADGSSADLAAAVESLAAGQRRLDAKLAEAIAMLAAIGEMGPNLAELNRSIEAATQWASNVKAANDTHLEAAGTLIQGLKGGRGDLDKVLAEMTSQQEGLKKQRETLDKGIGELRTLWKGANERSAKFESATRALANQYRDWTDQAATLQQEMAALSKVLRDSVDRMRESVNNNAKAQLDISVRIRGNVREFKTENDRFLARFDAGGQELLETVRREWTATRRWTVPALSAALVVAVMSFPVLGGYAQSRFGVFDPYDETSGWGQFVWDRHGAEVRACLLRSERTGKVVGCRLQVDGRGLFTEPAAQLPPLPFEG